MPPPDRQPAWPPSRRPRLAPGLRVVRRGLHHLQVGLYDGHRAVLPRNASVEHTLSLLLQPHPAVLEPEDALVIDQLLRHGCLAQDPDQRRTTKRVAVLGRLDDTGLPAPDTLLSAVGITPTSSPGEADAVLVLSAGELDRDDLDDLVRRGMPHVVVRLVDGGAVLGPFVVPGLTACLRCIDAHLTVRDPDHVAVTSRYARATEHARPDGVPDLDPGLVAVALAWAVRDMAAHLRGREPSTWSRTLFLGAEPADRKEQEWLRHPACGCSWAADARSSGTMEA